MKLGWFFVLITNLFVSFSHGFVSRIPLRFAHKRSNLVNTEIVNNVVSTRDDSVIQLTPSAKTHFDLIRNGKSPYCVRVGVKKGGCSGMSYTMDVVNSETIASDDHIEDFDGIKCIIDPKSMLFIFGLELDYSHDLIGGGFKFSNPNASKACGCGKSFKV